MPVSIVEVGFLNSTLTNEKTKQNKKPSVLCIACILMGWCYPIDFNTCQHESWTDILDESKTLSSSQQTLPRFSYNCKLFGIVTEDLFFFEKWNPKCSFSFRERTPSPSRLQLNKNQFPSACIPGTFPLGQEVVERYFLGRGGVKRCHTFLCLNACLQDLF